MRVWYGEIRNHKLNKKLDLDVENREPLEFDLVEFSIENSIFADRNEYYETLRDLAIESEEKRMKELLRSEDMFIIALIRTYDEVIRCINLLSGRVNEMKSLGYEDEEIPVIIALERRMNSLQKLREEIEDELEEKMEAIAPNLTRVAGHMIGARLIERAGGLKKLAMLPGSKIQVMGAERALYRSLSKGKKGKPPKHGIIYQHPMIRTLNRKVRGKMARYFAGKISIAVRLDYFSGNIDEKLDEDLKKRYQGLKGGSE